jgi:hypothetical protein
MQQMTDALRRIKRAKKHLDILNREIKAFVASEPFQVVIDKHTEAGYYIASPYFIKQYPISWGLLVGEVAHGLRSALDNIAWSIAITKDNRTEFPIFIKRSNDSIGRLKRFNENVRADVEFLQPYNAPDRVKRSHPLWVLRTIDIIDKHRVILPGATRITIATGLPSPNKFFYFDGFTRLNEGTIEFKIPIKDSAKEDFNPNITAQIGFDISSPLPSEADNPPRIRLEDLFVIYNFVRNEVYPRFTEIPEPENSIRKTIHLRTPLQ